MNVLLAALLLQAEGIAAAYPGDEGIEKDPRVLFVEDFESGDLRETASRWGDVAHLENLAHAAEIPPGSPGRRSLHISRNGHLYTHTKGVERLHARFYVRFHPKTGYVHHFVHLNAHRLPLPSPGGTAGIRPSGGDRFSTGIEPWGEWGKHPAPGIWHFYSYWHEMKGGRDGKYWGNHFEAPQPEPIQPGRWYCVEAMIQANRPGEADGGQAFWIDGRPVGSFTGIRWRTDAAVLPNTFWLLYYITENAARQNRDTATDRVYEVWFDDIVLATSYIGPVSGTPKAGKKAAVPGRSALQAPPPPPDPAVPPVYSQNFESGPGPFRNQEVRDGALLLSPKGVETWNAWSVPAGPATELRFRVRPLDEVGDLTVQIWSDRLKDNVRWRVTGLRKGEWREVALPVAALRLGWAMDGAAFEGSAFNNVRFFFQGGPETRVLLDDLEVRK
jgi:hypothetical protein